MPIYSNVRIRESDGDPDILALRELIVNNGVLTDNGNGTATLDYDTRYHTQTDLASTDNGLGASLIGVEDDVGNFAAANVEAVLAELNTTIDGLTWATILSQGNLSGGTNPRISTGDNLEFRNILLHISSPATGELEITSNDRLILTATNDVEITSGFVFARPAAGANVLIAAIDDTADTGIYYNRVAGIIEEVTLGGSCLTGPDERFHRFVVRGVLVGDMEHTDGTRSIFYDASLNRLSFSGAAGTINSISGDLILLATGGLVTVNDIFETQQGRRLNEQTVTAATVTVLTSDEAFAGDATSNNILFNLPPLSGIEGQIFEFKKIDSSANTLTLDGNGSDTIDGSLTQVISVQYNSITIVARTAEWGIR